MWKKTVSIQQNYTRGDFTITSVARKNGSELTPKRVFNALFGENTAKQLLLCIRAAKLDAH